MRFSVTVVLVAVFIFANGKMSAQPAAQNPKPKYSIGFKSEKNDTIHISQTENVYPEVELLITNTDEKELEDHTLTVSVDKGTFPADKVEVITAIENKKFKDLKINSPNIVALRIKKKMMGHLHLQNRLQLL